MNLTTFIRKLNTHPETIEFSDTMAIIDANYNFSPTTFTNGDTLNKANQNNGSCKIFAFGLKNNLSFEQTLACFGSYYRDDVLNNPQGDDHQNIRNFMISKWDGIKFEGDALTLR